MRVFKFVTAVMFWVAVSLAMAQTLEHEHEDVQEEVLVTSTPLGDAVQEVVQPISVLSGEALLDKQAGTIGEMLSAELGVTSSDFGQAVGRPVIRGMMGSRVRVLESSIGTMDLSTVSADHAVAIEPFFARQIEVLRGPSTLLYGSGALGGVVNVVDNRIPVNHEAFAGRAEVSGNTVSDECTGMFELDTISDGFAWHWDALSRQSGDYKIPGFAIHADDSHGVEVMRKRVVENSDVDFRSMATGVSYSQGRGFLGLSVSRIENNYGLPGGEHHAESAEPAGAVSIDAGPRLDMKQTRVDFKGRLEEPFGGFTELMLRGGFNDYQHAELEENGEVATRFGNDEMETRLELVQAEVNDWRGALGVQYGQRKFSAIGDEAFVPPVNSSMWGVFVIEHKHMQDWNLELGARLESQKYAPSAADEQDFSVASYSVGTIYRLSEPVSLNLSLAHSERAPSTEELYSNGPHLVTQTFERGSHLLDKERAISFDFSVHYVAERVNWQLGVFRNRMDQYIFLQTRDQNSDGVADRVDETGSLVVDANGLLQADYVQDDAEFSGAEAEIGFGLIHTALQKLDVRFFADTVRGRLQAGGNLPRMTPKRAGVELTYECGGWRYGLDVMYVAKQSRVAVLEEPTDGYTTVSADMRYSLPWGSGSLDLFVKTDNLTNQEIRRHTSFLKDAAPLPGRNVQVGVRAYF